MGNGCSDCKVGKYSVRPLQDAQVQTSPVTGQSPAKNLPAPENRNRTSLRKNVHEITLSSASTDRKVFSSIPTIAEVEPAACIDLPSTSINRNSILFGDRDSPPLSIRPTLMRSISTDETKSSTTKPSTSKRFSVNLNRLQLFKSSPNVSDEVKSVREKANEKSLSKLYTRFSGSVQTIFQSKDTNGRRRRQLSASDTDLSACGSHAQVLSQQQLIDRDYCPSVIYNRKARRCNEQNTDKSQTFVRWKNQILSRLSRKRTETMDNRNK